MVVQRGDETKPYHEMKRKIEFLPKISPFIVRPGQGKSRGNCLALVEGELENLEKYMDSINILR